MSKLFAVREEILNTKEGRKKLEDFIKKEDKIPPFSVLQLDEVEDKNKEPIIICKPFSKRVTDDSKVSSERKQTTLLSLLLIQEGKISSFYASEDVLLRHLEAMDSPNRH